MDFHESLLSKTERYSFSPSAEAKAHLFYPLSIGHFFGANDYACSPTAEHGYFLFYTIKGAFRLSTEFGVEPIPQNALALTDATTAQTFFADSSAFEILFLHFDGKDAAHLLDYIFSKGSFVCAVKNPKAVKKSLILLLRSLKEKKILSEGEMSAKIYEILCSCLYRAQKQPKETEDYEKTTTLAEAYIWENLNTPLTVKAIAQEVHMSSSHFSKIFKLETGSSPYDYVLSARLMKAKEYLSATDKSISQISALTGFNSESNFVYFFTTNTGISPLKYRKQHREML